MKKSGSLKSALLCHCHCQYSSNFSLTEKFNHDASCRGSDSGRAVHFSNCRFFSYHFIKKRGMILEITKIDHDHCRDNTTKSFLVLGKIYIYIFLFRSVPVWQKNNISLTPVSQANYQNFCPKQSNFNFGLPVD